MWRYLIRVGQGSMRWLSRAFKSGAKYIPRVFGSGVKGKTASVLRTIWRVVDIGLTGYFVYDLFFSDDNAEGSAVAANDFIYNQLLPIEICYALEANLNDSDAVGLAFAIAGTKLMDDQMDASSLKAVSYLALPSYLDSVRPGSTMKNPDMIKSILKEETGNFLSQDPSLGEDERAEIVEAINDMNFEDMEIGALRRFDFLTYIMEELSDYAESLTKSQATTNVPGANLNPLSPGSTSSEDAQLNRTFN